MRAGHAEARLGTVADPASPPGWRAELALHFAPRRGRTALVARRQHGPLTVQRPFHPEGEVCHTYVLHPPAGIVGGDDLRMTFTLDPGAHGLVTTPAATRWYWSDGREARVTQHATVADGAVLEWLPQETLLFDGAHGRLTTRIDLAGDARFCGWEILGLGRPACDEPFTRGRVDFRFELFRDGRPLVLERLRGGDGGFPGMRGDAALATLLATGARADTLAAVRAALGTPDATRAGTPKEGAGAAEAGACAGATLIGDVLVCRALAPRCEPLAILFAKVWAALRPLTLGRPAVPPRIWRT